MDDLTPTPPPAVRRSRAIPALNILLGAAALAAVAALLLEYGFPEPPIPRGFLHAAGGIIVGVFVLDRFARLALSRRRMDYVHSNWIDFALILSLLIALAVSIRLRKEVISAGQLYVIITQGYMLVSLILRGVSVNLRFAGSGIPPSCLLLGSFALMCLAGSGLLMLPAATPPDSPIYYYDAVFTATSATCVTGLIVRDTGGDFTPFGQAVILVLIQVGALGIMLSGTMLAMLMGKELSLRGSNALGQMLSQESIGRLGRTIAFAVAAALALEVIGAVMFYPMFAAPQGGTALGAPGAKAVWDSVFHSISSFCNAGFSLYEHNMMAGVRDGWAEPLRGHWQVMGVMAPLIVLGGLGFPVLKNCAAFVVGHARRLVRRLRPATLQSIYHSARPRLSLHSKLVLTASVLLIAWGAIVLLLVEPPAGGRESQVGLHPISGGPGTPRGALGDMSGAGRLREATFQSITARTAGFNTIEMAELSDAGKLWMCLLMTIGGSPAGTAGGMKTVTFVVLLLAAYSVLRRRKEIEFFRRSISAEVLRMTVTVAVLYLTLVVTITLLLCVAIRPEAHHEYGFVDALFEACSACGTVGLSTGITRELNPFGKYVIIAGMFVGRLGPLTLLLALTSGVRRLNYAYPTEHVVIG